MDSIGKNDLFDVIIIGSGICGATLARELSQQNKKVLILERGKNVLLKETLMSIVSIAHEVRLGEKGLSTVRAITTGGSTGLYFGVVNYPQLDVFRQLGIELTEELEAVKNELPISQVPDHLLNPQSVRLRNSAQALGFDWRKNDMLIDLAKCGAGYSYEAKWKAKSYVEDALKHGVTLITQATVKKVITENDVASGVEYQLKKHPFSSETRRAFAAKIILSAGEIASPQILRDSGMQDIAERGFYCNPGYAIYGLVPGLRGTNGFVGNMSCEYEEGIELGDANVPKVIHGPMMLGRLKFRHCFSFPETLGIGVKVSDELGGSLSCGGKLRKTFTREDKLKLDKGKREALRILKQAGAKDIFDFGVTAAGRIGGMVRIQEHVDKKLETRYRNLYVCDGSVLPDAERGSPSISLICLAKYLSKHILSSF